MKRLLLLFVPIFAGGLSTGCAMATGVMAIGGWLPTNNYRESVTAVGRPERRTEVTAELAPLAIRCVQQERAPRERVRAESDGFSLAGRMTMGFVSVGEAALTGAILWSGTREGPLSTEIGVLAAVIGVDAITTMILAFALPHRPTLTIREREGTWRTTVGCPADLSITYAGRALPVTPDGHLQLADETWLLSRWVTAGGSAQIGVGGRVQPLAATTEHRCLWARQRGLPEAAALCANVSTTAAAPVQLTLDLGVAVR